MAASERDLRLTGQPFLFSSDRQEEIRGTVIRMLPDSEINTEEPSQEDEGPIPVRVRPLEPRDLYKILPWFSDPEALGHLEPLPRLPQDWNDENEVMETVLDLGKYYNNQGEPEKIAPIIAANMEKDRPLAVATIRWRGDPWVPEGHKIASIERVLVNPRIRGREVGRQLMREAHRTVFGKGFNEVRVWVFVDDKAGHDKGGRNLHFFHNVLGYDILRGENYSWREYAKKRGLGENVQNREAFWLSLKVEDWEEMEKQERRALQLFPNPNGSK